MGANIIPAHENDGSSGECSQHSNLYTGQPDRTRSLRPELLRDQQSIFLVTERPDAGGLCQGNSTNE